MARLNPFNLRPRKVVMLGLGQSIVEYVQHQVAQELRLQYDAIWTCNMGLKVFKHDVLWVMDDLRLQAKKFPEYGRLLAEHDRPIITSQAYPEFPQSWTYPIEKVVKEVGHDYFRNTVAYAIGYAMTHGVKDLTLYGCDFWYPQLDIREEGAMNAGFLLGVARHFGMQFHIAPSSTLLSAHLAQPTTTGGVVMPLYGYVNQPFYKEIKNDAAGSETSTEVRANQGNNAGSTNGSKPLRQAKKRARRAAVIHPGRKGLQRGRAGNPARRAAGMVLDGVGQNDAQGKSRVRGGPASEILSGPDGEVKVSARDYYAHLEGKFPAKA